MPAERLHVGQAGDVPGLVDDDEPLDLVRLSDDLTAVDPERIASLQVLATVVGGEARHDVGLG